MQTTDNQLPRQKVQNALGKTEHLPPTPEILVSLLRIVDDPEVGAEEIGEIVQVDAALSLSLLRLVNSAAYGLMREVTNVSDAVKYVGSTEVKNLTIAIAVKTGLIGKAPVCNSFDRLALSRNFLTSGIAAHVVAEMRGLSCRKTAFAAGLLHQCGFLLIDAILPHRLQFYLSEVELGNEVFPKNEAEVVGVTHGEVGTWLATKWDIPQALIEPMMSYEKPWQASSQAELAGVVHIGNRLGAAIDPIIPRPEPPRVEPRCLELLDIDPDMLDEVKRELGNELDRLAFLMDS